MWCQTRVPTMRVTRLEKRANTAKASIPISHNRSGTQEREDIPQPIGGLVPRRECPMAKRQRARHTPRPRRAEQDDSPIALPVKQPQKIDPTMKKSGMRNICWARENSVFRYLLLHIPPQKGKSLTIRPFAFTNSQLARSQRSRVVVMKR